MKEGSDLDHTRCQWVLVSRPLGNRYQEPGNVWQWEKKTNLVEQGLSPDELYSTGRVSF